MKKLKTLLTACLLTLCLSVPSALGAASVLPEVDSEYAECDISSSAWEETWAPLFESNPDEIKAYLDTATKDNVEAILGCALKSGEIQFWMVPYYIIFIMEFVLELAGLITVLMIMVGGYYYIAGGLTDDKEKGKTIITYALGGMALSLSAWILVNVLLLALTS